MALAAFPSFVHLYTSYVVEFRYRSPKRESNPELSNILLLASPLNAVPTVQIEPRLPVSPLAPVAPVAPVSPFSPLSAASH